MHAIIKTHIKFNQIWHFDDVRVGGNCFAYTALYFTYISFFHLKDQPVEYFALLDVLNNIPVKEKRELQLQQDSNVKNNAIATLNRNKEGVGSANIPGFKRDCQNIFDNLSAFEKPSFYFVEYIDLKNTLLGSGLSHAVGIYIASKKQIHFFDSVSGLYILDLPDNYSKENLHDDLIELMFKKNFLLKNFADTQSQTLIFCNYESHFVNEEKNRNQEAKDFLCSFIVDPNVDASLTAFPKEIQNFLKLNMYVIQQINMKMENKKENTSITKYLKYGAILSIAVVGESFFAHRLLQKNASDVITDTLKNGM